MIVTAVDDAPYRRIDLHFDDAGIASYEIDPSPGAGSIVTPSISYSLTDYDLPDGWTASSGHGGAGVIQVTELSDDRVRGIFSGTLPAQLGQDPATVTLTGGTFDIGGLDRAGS